MPTEAHVREWHKGERNEIVVRYTGDPEVGWAVRVGYRVPLGAGAEHAYRTRNDCTMFACFFKNPNQQGLRQRQLIG